MNTRKSKKGRKAQGGPLTAKEAGKPLESTIQQTAEKAAPERQKNLDQMLFSAVEKRDTQEMKDLIDMGADVNAQDDQGRTLLMKAGWSRGVVKLLLKHGADPMIQDDNGRNAVMKAFESAQKNTITFFVDGLEVANAMVDALKDVDEQIRSDGTTLLMWAASTPYFTTAVSSLIKAGADPEARNERGETALMVACRSVELYYGMTHLYTGKSMGSSYAEMSIEELLKHGADPKATDNERKTALMKLPHRAVVDWQRFQGTADVLRKLGAD